MRARHLFLTLNEVERLVGAPVLPSAFEPQPFAKQGETAREHTVVERLMHLLAADVRLGSPSGAVFAQSVLGALLHHLMARPAASAPARLGTVSGRDWRVAHMLERIHTDIAARVSLTQLAVEVGVSVQYLCRIFKRATGLTPHRYILRERVVQARTLIAPRSLPLADVAHLSGFADQSQMTTTFKHVLGVTPSAFRPRRGRAPERDGE